MRAALILFCCTGCSWGIEALRAKNAVDIEAAAKRITVAAPEHSEPYKEALDIWERTQVMKKDHGLPPKEIAREDADVTFNALAGLVEARNVKRRKIREIPGKIGSFVGDTVKGWIPTWVWYAGGSWLFISLGGIGLLVKCWRQTRAALDGMIKIGNRKGAKEVFRGQTNGLVKKRYRKLRDEGLLETDEEQEERV